MISRLIKNPHWPTAFVFVVFTFGLTGLSMIDGAEEVSRLERRDLAQAPDVSFNGILDGDFTEEYAQFLQDQMVFRDDFRFVKSIIERRLLQKSENNGVYIVGDQIFDKFYGVQNQFIERAARIMNEIAEDSRSNRVFLSVIPTKAQTLDRDVYLLTDQTEISESLEANVRAEYIDLMGLAEPGNERLYYVTDPHWTTEGAIFGYRLLAKALGHEPVGEYEFEVATDSYVGSEYGRAASWSIGKDTIVLARNRQIDEMSICRFATLVDRTCYDSVYLENKVDDLDPYDVFLGGLSPIIEIENPASDSDRELVMFKDSYAHALAPFLAQHYSKVTLFDQRFVRRQLIVDNFDLSEADILFIFSTSVLNTDPQVLN